MAPPTAPNLGIAAPGRMVDFVWDGAPLLGVKEKGASANGEPINVSSDEDSGWQVLLETPGENKVEIKLSGVSKDTRLKQAWYGGDRLKLASFTYPNGDTLEAYFFLANFNEGIPFNDAITFEASLQSSGEVVYTPYA